MYGLVYIINPTSVESHSNSQIIFSFEVLLLKMVVISNSVLKCQCIVIIVLGLRRNCG